MKSAFLIPVLRKRFSDDMPVDVGDSFWAVDAWITPPLASDVPLNRWTKNIKITETHALFYYSLKTTVALASGQPQIGQQEAVGDVLYLRLRGGVVVDVDEDDVDEMHRILPSLL